MKKTKTKQLRLTRQTIAKLTQRELAGVRGAAGYTYTCYLYTSACAQSNRCMN